MRGIVPDVVRMAECVMDQFVVEAVKPLPANRTFMFSLHDSSLPRGYCEVAPAGHVEALFCKARGEISARNPMPDAI